MDGLGGAGARCTAGDPREQVGWCNGHPWVIVSACLAASPVAAEANPAPTALVSPLAALMLGRLCRIRSAATAGSWSARLAHRLVAGCWLGIGWCWWGGVCSGPGFWKCGAKSFCMGRWLHNRAARTTHRPHRLLVGSSACELQQPNQQVSLRHPGYRRRTGWHGGGPS